VQTDPYDLSVADAAELLGVHADTIRRWAKTGQLHSWRTPGKQRRFRKADVLALLPPDRAEQAAS
jgi:excisionase family DNA binding protein